MQDASGAPHKSQTRATPDCSIAHVYSFSYKQLTYALATCHRSTNHSLLQNAEGTLLSMTSFITAPKLRGKATGLCTLLIWHDHASTVACGSQKILPLQSTFANKKFFCAIKSPVQQILLAQPLSATSKTPDGGSRQQARKKYDMKNCGVRQQTNAQQRLPSQRFSSRHSPPV